MFDDAYTSVRRPRRRYGRWLVLSAAAAIGVVAGRHAPSQQPTLTAERQPAPAPAAAVRPQPARIAWLLDPNPTLGARASTLTLAAPLGPDFHAAPAKPSVAPMVVAAIHQAAPTPASAPFRQTARLAQTVPLPMARPSDLLAARVAQTPRLAERAIPTRTRTASRVTPEEDRSFFETVFGAQEEPAPALAYASADGGAVTVAPRGRISPSPLPQVGAGTAIYDISAGRVTLPSGEVLEAHSGLGNSMDNPDHVHLRMRGSTPPATYDLTEREALFHGVRALRLNPVGGAGTIHGRTGLLAHTYMLGRSGASNGCISFRDYNRFLQAYLRGEVRRVVVVPGRQDGFPAFAGKLFGRSAKAGDE